jgi:hypothetical protein
MNPSVLVPLSLGLLPRYIPLEGCRYLPTCSLSSKQNLQFMSHVSTTVSVQLSLSAACPSRFLFDPLVEAGMSASRVAQILSIVATRPLFSSGPDATDHFLGPDVKFSCSWPTVISPVMLTCAAFGAGFLDVLFRFLGLGVWIVARVS